MPSKWHFCEFGGRFRANPYAPQGYDKPTFVQKYPEVGHFGNFFPYPDVRRAVGAQGTANADIFLRPIQNCSR